MQLFVKVPLTYCCILERESDTDVRHFDEEIDLEDLRDAVNEKRYTAVNDKEARGMCDQLNKAVVVIRLRPVP